jgi:hypothetical protein
MIIVEIYVAARQFAIDPREDRPDAEFRDGLG